MSLDELRAFLRSATPESIAQLPVTRLPEELPSSIYDEVRGAAREALEGLVFEASSYQLNERMRQESVLGAEVVEGLKLAQRLQASSTLLAFVDELNTVQSELSRAKTSMTVAEFKALTQRVSRMDSLLGALKEESSQIYRARDAVVARLANGTDETGELSAARKRLDAQHERIDKVVSHYFYLRLLIIGKEMSRVRRKAEQLDQTAEEIQFRIDRAREQLEAFNNRPLQRAQPRVRERMQTLREEINRLLEEKDRHQVLISENDLTGWLDALVDAYVSPKVRDRISKYGRETRLVLYSLLDRYCGAQEEAARQVARNPFSQVDPKKTIRFLLQSEQFVLDYFAQKKSNLTAWLGGAAQRRIELLGDLEAEMLNELRQSARLAKR